AARPHHRRPPPAAARPAPRPPAGRLRRPGHRRTPARPGRPRPVADPRPDRRPGAPPGRRAAPPRPRAAGGRPDPAAARPRGRSRRGAAPAEPRPDAAAARTGRPPRPGAPPRGAPGRPGPRRRRARRGDRRRPAAHRPGPPAHDPDRRQTRLPPGPGDPDLPARRHLTDHRRPPRPQEAAITRPSDPAPVLVLAVHASGARVRVGYADIAAPDVGRAAAEAGGAAVVVPAFLASGYHVRTDIPAQLARAGCAGTPVAPALDGEPRTARAAARRLREAGHRPGEAVVLAAAGSSDPRALTEARAAARVLSALVGAPVETGFIATATPTAAE